MFNRLVCAVLVMLLCSQSWAAGSMNAAVSSLVQEKVAKRLYAVPPGQVATLAQRNAVANDVRFRATVESLGTAATVVAAGAGSAVVVGTSIAWGPLLAVAGISAAFTGAVSLAVGGIQQWLFEPDGTVTLPGASAAGITSGASAYTSNCAGNGNVWGSSASAVAAGCNQLAASFGGYNVYSTVSCNATSCQMQRTDGSNDPPFLYTIYISGGTAPDTCTSGNWIQGIGCGSGLPGGSVTVPAASAASSVPSGDQALPANPAILAAAANLLWKLATDAGYPGIVPFDPQDPITVPEAESFTVRDPAAVPDVAALVGPAAAPGSPTVAIPQPVTSPDAGVQPLPGEVVGSSAPNANGGQDISMNIDWGSLAPPALDTPTIASILDPLFDLWPDWKNFAFPAHTSTCPTPSFTLPGGVVGGHTVSFTQMCTWVEQVQAPLQAVFAMVWSVMIVFIVMGA